MIIIGCGLEANGFQLGKPIQSLNVSDSVVMGDITQVYNDDKTIQTISFQSIFESKCLEHENPDKQKKSSPMHILKFVRF